MGFRAPFKGRFEKANGEDQGCFEFEIKRILKLRLVKLNILLIKRGYFYFL
jgi:hypothetical protein